MKELNHEENERRKLAMANLLWMQYFNRYAFEKGVITERERNTMKLKIDAKYGPEAGLPDLYSSH